MINLIEKPTIVGENIILRPFEIKDITEMIECLKDEEVKKFTGSQTVFSDETLINWYNTRNEQTDRLDLAIECKDSHVVVGEAVVNEYSSETESMNFRILIGPKGRNRGLGTEATKLISNYIFTQTQLKQLTLDVYAFNPRARRVYEKAGFEVVSIDKEELEYEGEMIDQINMVLTREMWEASQN